MAYRKLTQAVIDTIVSELREGRQACFDLRSIGCPVRVFSLRSVCEKAGISHTTFYRWMHEYRALKGRKGQLTDSELQVLSFGRAVEGVAVEGVAVEGVAVEIDRFKEDWSAEEFGALLFGETDEELEDLLLGETVPEDEEIDSIAETREESDASSWEELTDQLTGGIRLVEFDLPNFTKKHVN